jgi:hypothetical protein
MLKKTLVSFITIFFTSIVSQAVFADIELMADSELSELTAQAGFMEMTTGEGRRINDLTGQWEKYDYARIFLDAHLEASLTIGSLKAGYYYKAPSELGVSNMSVGLSGLHDYVEKRYDDHVFLNIETSMDPLLVPQPPADPNHTRSVANHHTTDWDLWIDNISTAYPDAGGNVDFSTPGYFDGLIFRAEFDDLDASNPVLQRIIVGSNFRQGNEFVHLHRLSGMVNPNLLAHEQGRSAGNKTPYETTGSAMLARRDPYVENFRVNVFNLSDRDTGFWVAISNTGGHVGYELIAGFPEAACDFSYKYGVQGIDLWGDGTGMQPDPDNSAPVYSP